MNPWTDRFLVFLQTILLILIAMNFGLIADPVTNLENYVSSNILHSQINASNIVITDDFYVSSDGGVCTCPDGYVYNVGQYKNSTLSTNTDNPSNLACEFGTAGSVVYTTSGEWSKRKVVCNQAPIDTVSNLVKNIINSYIILPSSAISSEINSKESFLEIQIYAFR